MSFEPKQPTWKLSQGVIISEKRRRRKTRKKLSCQQSRSLVEFEGRATFSDTCNMFPGLACLLECKSNKSRKSFSSSNRWKRRKKRTNMKEQEVVIHVPNTVCLCMLIILRKNGLFVGWWPLLYLSLSFIGDNVIQERNHSFETPNSRFDGYESALISETRSLLFITIWYQIIHLFCTFKNQKPTKL